jgi:hypothetical protein
MRLCPHSKPSQSGSTLLVTLLLAVILGMTLAGYLSCLRSQNVLVAQSQAWNTAMAYAEAGIEEGMAQINVTFGTNYMPSLLTNWASLGGVTYGPRTNAFPNGSYSVIIQATYPTPTIISTGYCIVPPIGRQVVRTIQVTTTNRAVFDNAMCAQQNISFAGNNVSVDSYDSSDPLHSTNGLYYPPTRKAGGDVASLYGLIAIQNANVNGLLLTGPTGSYTVGSSGFVGDLNWTGPGLENGWWYDDFNMEIKDVTPPDTAGFLPVPAGITNTYLLGSGGYYINGDLTISSGQSLFVAGFATLYISGELNMNGSSEIDIAPGAQLKIYCAGATSTMTTINNSGNAYSFQYYGLPGNTIVNWGGNAEYIGTVYAPEAYFNCGGGGSGGYGYQGSCIVNSIKLNGHFDFHYDESLRRLGPQAGFKVKTWQEL